jgi:hypothetical protein
LLLRNRKKKQAGRDGVGVSKSIEQAKNNQKAINQKSKRPFFANIHSCLFLLVSLLKVLRNKTAKIFCLG